MNTKRSFSKIGIFFGLALGLVSLMVGGLNSGWVLRAMESEHRAYIQQSIGDATSILAEHFRGKMEDTVGRLTELGATTLHTLVDASRDKKKDKLKKKDKNVDEAPESEAASPDAEKDGAGTSPAMGVVETDSDILDVSLWRKNQGDGKDAAVSIPHRTFLAVNSRYPDADPELSKQEQNAEESEKNLIQGAFQGRSIFFLSPVEFGHKTMGSMAIPLGSGVIEEVLLAHIRLDKLKNAFSGNRLVNGFLVDNFGNTLVNLGSPGVRPFERLPQNPLYQAMQASTIGSGQLMFSDQSGSKYYGGYSLIGVGNLGVLATVPELEVRTSIKLIKRQVGLFLSVFFLLFLAVGYVGGARVSGEIEDARRLAPSSSTTGTGSGTVSMEISKTEIESAAMEPKTLQVSVLYGNLRQISRLMESCTPEDALEAINDFFTIASQTVKEYGGTFERNSEKSFLGIWGATSSDGSDVWRSLRCSLALRKNIFNYSESRKVDGLTPISIGIGVHTGMGLLGLFGPPQQLRCSVAGEALNCAKSLSQLTVSMRVDLLISQTIWQQSDGKFIGDLQGEVKLTHDTGLTGVYSLTGYRNEEGQTVTSEVPMEAVQFSASESREDTSPEMFSGQKKSNRWLINNGSQIIGPLEEKEIALRLFAQELDFDCECWTEGAGNSAILKNAGIFSGSGDSGAELWMFDGATIHGPVSGGFIKTAVGHGAIPEQVYICQSSTVNGWKTLAQWEETAPEFSPNPIQTQVQPPVQAQPLVQTRSGIQISPQPQSAQAQVSQARKEADEKTKALRASLAPPLGGTGFTKKIERPAALAEEKDPSKKVA